MLNKCKAEQRNLRSLASGSCVVIVVNFGFFCRKDTACDKALGFNAETEMCSCCRHFNPNEWEVADSCNDVLQHRMERVRITKEKALYSSQQAGLF